MMTAEHLSTPIPLAEHFALDVGAVEGPDGARALRLIARVTTNDGTPESIPTPPFSAAVALALARRLLLGATLIDPEGTAAALHEARQENAHARTLLDAPTTVAH